jgi:RimJ/RimL family protein N-acetyltransferase
VGEITLWGQSVGARALYLALEWLREYGCRKVHTTILKNNPSSRALFKKMGFEEIGKAREGEIAVELYLI